MENSIPEAIFKSAQKNLKKPALLYKKEGVYYPISYGELVKKVENFSAALRNLGIKKGEKVAILSENRPEWAISDLAIMNIGAIVVPVHTSLSPNVIKYILNHSGVEILIVSNENLLHKALFFESELTNLKKIIAFEKIPEEYGKNVKQKILDWQEIISRKDYRQFEKVDISPDDLCTIIYTSGTTGLPKGAMLTHKNILSNAESVNDAVPVKGSDVFLSFLPLSHVLERLAGYYLPLIFGATIAYAEGIKQLKNNLKEVRPTILICVPRVFEKFYDAIWDKINKGPGLSKKIFLWSLKRKKGSFSYNLVNALVFSKIRKEFGGRLRFSVSGGASLSTQIEKFFLRIGMLVLEGYGLTETSPVIAVNRVGGVRVHTVGKVVKGVSVEISEEKEIMIKGPNVFKGYYDNEEETKKAFDRHGWFLTGDMGHLDNDGYLSVIGRKKEMIVSSGGKNIWPETIEHLLNNDKYITQSMIIGHSRKFVSALLYPDWEEINNYMKERNLPAKDIKELACSNEVLKVMSERIEKINCDLCDWEKIRKFKIITAEFSQDRDELTPTLKLRRHIIAKNYKNEIETMYI